MKVNVNYLVKNATNMSRMQVADLQAAWDFIRSQIVSGRMDIDGLISIEEYQ